MIKSLKNFKAFSVYILGTEYHIVNDYSIEEYGLCEPDIRTIKLNMAKHKTLDEANSTLYHEMLHAALDASGISHILKTKEEEAVVRCLENALWPHIAFRR